MAKINTLTLTNFRGARYLSLDFNPGVNLLIGTNGAGKSTVLDAAALSLSWLVNRIKTRGAAGRPISENDITVQASAARVEICAQLNDEDYQWQLVKARRGREVTDGRSELGGVNELAAIYRNKISEADGQLDLPLFAYFPVNRAVLDIPLRIRSKHKFDQLSAYEESLTSGANFRVFFEWFREREDLENETKRDHGQEKSDRELDAVRDALSAFLPGYERPRVLRNPLRMVIDKAGQELSVSQLSDGEKCLMALVGDLARRLAIANPTSLSPLTGEGVVMIDEVDLHLHPKWQREMVQKLVEIFPNCQFLLSTHSPHVMTHIPSDSIYLISNLNGEVLAERPGISFGKSAEQILEDVMGLETTRPKKIEESLKKIYEAISDGKLAAANARIEKLQIQIGPDPDLVRAAALIRRKELARR